MARMFCIPGIFFLFAAFVLLLVTSINLPFLTALDFTRTHFNTGSNSTNVGNIGNGTEINQLRFGIWAYCTYNAQNGDRDCPHTGHGYEFELTNAQKTQTVTIGSSWTRGLAIHPVAAIVTFIALLFSFSQHVTMTLVASLLSFLAAAITLIAFLVDCALLAFVRHEFGNLSGVDETTITGPGFWLTFVALLLLLLAGCTVCFGRRRDRMAKGNSYPMSSRPFWRRFGRN